MSNSSRLMPFDGEILQRVLDVAIGVLAEVLHADVAGRRVDHEVRGHRRDVHLVARDVERNRLRRSRGA